jgi:hypothetical protein
MCEARESESLSATIPGHVVGGAGRVCRRKLDGDDTVDGKSIEDDQSSRMRRRQAQANSIVNRADGRWSMATHLVGVDLRVCRWMSTP